MYKHHAMIDRCLFDAAIGKLKRVIIQMPPRHGKSFLASKYFPAWYMGMFGDRNMLITSTTQDLAKNWSQDSRDILAEHGEQLFGFGLSKDDQGAKDWKTTRGGECRAIGAGGSAYGFGAHAIVIDDYHGSIEDALSLAERNHRHRWYHGTIRNRLNSETEGTIIIVATPYHKDDLASRLIKEQETGGDKWYVLKLPAIAGQNDQLGRKPGEALWPEKWSLAHLEKERKALETAGYPWMFDALYQCEPSDVVDSEFPSEFFGDGIYFDYWPHHSQIVSRVVHVDPSMGKSEKSDYSAIIALAKDRDGTYWCDADLRRRPVTELAQDAISIFTDFEGEALGCETNAFQELVGERLQEEAERVRIDCWFVGVHNNIDKRVRIRKLTSPLAQGRIRFKRHSPGVNLLIEQLRGFPAHKHDDGPDALEGAIRLINHTLAGTIHEHTEGSPDYVRP